MALFSKFKTIKSTTAVFVFGIWLPTTLMTIVFRAIRIYQRGAIKDAVVGIDVYKSDILFLAAGLLLGLLFLHLLRNQKYLLRVFLGFSLLGGLIITAIESIAFRFFGASGSTIDFSLIFYTLENFEETQDVLRSEVPNWLVILLAILVVLYLLLPLAVNWVWKKLFVSVEKDHHFALPIVLGIVGLLSFLFAFFPPFKEPSLAFAKNATLHVVSTGVSEFFIENKTLTLAANFDTSKIDITGESKTNVVFIILESTRASATSLYNPELKTTPFLKELESQSAVAKRAYSIVPHTSKALTASLCGIPPNLRMTITEATNGGIPGNCLAKLLSRKGYKTSFFQSATKRFEGRSTLVKNMGYKDFYPSETFSKKGFEKANYFGREDDIMLKPSLKWLKKNKTKGPVFMTYLTLTPHHNYDAPKRYGFEQYVKDNKQFNRYLNTIHYVDQFTKNVVQMFKDEGLYEDTLFVIYGDHGEAFGEHGRKQHDNVIWEEGTRIPLIFHKPGTFDGGKKIENISNQLDIVPTTLSILGFKTETGKFAGENVLLDPKNRTLFSYCWYDRRCIAIREGSKKYIYHFGQQVDEFYDLDTDPDEKKNIIDTLDDPKSWVEKGIAWRSSVKGVYQGHYRHRIDKFISKLPPKMDNKLDYQFENYVKLIGYDLKPKGPYSRGARVNITTYWQVLKPVPEKYLLFMHGYYSKASKRQIFDHIPIGGFYPVNEWQVGDFISDEHRFRIPRLTTEQYYLTYGIYKKPKGRLKVNGDEKLTEARIDIPLKVRVKKEPIKKPIKTKIPKLKLHKPLFPPIKGVKGKGSAKKTKK